MLQSSWFFQVWFYFPVIIALAALPPFSSVSLLHQALAVSLGRVSTPEYFQREFRFSLVLASTSLAVVAQC